MRGMEALNYVCAGSLLRRFKTHRNTHTYSTYTHTHTHTYILYTHINTHNTLTYIGILEYSDTDNDDDDDEGKYPPKKNYF